MHGDGAHAACHVIGWDYTIQYYANDIGGSNHSKHRTFANLDQSHSMVVDEMVDGDQGLMGAVAAIFVSGCGPVTLSIAIMA